MFVFGNLVIAIAKMVDLILTIFWWLILIRALISWVSPDPFNPIVQFLQRVTEPILNPIRKALKMQFWAIDISPIIAIICLIFLQSFFVRTLTDIALRLK